MFSPYASWVTEAYAFLNTLFRTDVQHYKWKIEIRIVIGMVSITQACLRPVLATFTEACLRSLFASFTRPATTHA